MSYARLRSELLAARDAREALLGAILAEAATTLVFASTAVPGPRKRPPGIDALLGWGVARLQDRLDACRLLLGGSDPLGPYAVLAVEAAPLVIKRACVAIEDGRPAARLLDLDVYGADAARVGRVDIGEPPRRCLLCEQPAADCIRLGRHPMEALIERVECLLGACDGVRTSSIMPIRTTPGTWAISGKDAPFLSPSPGNWGRYLDRVLEVLLHRIK